MSTAQVRNTTESQFHINAIIGTVVSEAIVLPATREGEGPVVPVITAVDEQLLDTARKNPNGVVESYFAQGFLTIVKTEPAKAESKKAA